MIDNIVRAFFNFTTMSRLVINHSVEDVWEATENGLTVFENEIEDFSLNKNVKNPFEEEKNPSARIKQSKQSGLWLLNIYNSTGGYYTALSFIEKKYGLNKEEAINYILENTDVKPIIKKETKIQLVEPVKYNWEIQKFEEKHCKYYCLEGITEEFLNKEMDIYALKAYSTFNKVYVIKDNITAFVYEYKDIYSNTTNKIKILKLGKDITKAEKWRNNCIPTDFFYSYKIKNGDLVFLSKSNKDAVVTQHLGITSIAAMSENYQNIATGLKSLIQLFPKCKFVVNLGSDLQGFETSFKLSKEFNLQWFNTKKQYLSLGVNDNWEYCKTFGIENFKKELKKKGFL